MEWVFHITKPSVLSRLEWQESTIILLLIPLLSIIALTPIIASLMILAPNLSKFSSRLLFSVLITISCLLLIDNFTYTLFSYYSGSFKNWFRYCYAVGLIIIFIYWYRKYPYIYELLDKWCEGLFIKIILITVISLSFYITISERDEESALLIATIKQPIRTPNIIILSSDGIDASRLPMYGYNRNTSPFIDSLLPDGLLVRNHLTNSANTTASVGALLSGKHPATTKLIFRPDIYRGIHKFQHLPGYLKKLGYHNYDISTRYYIDPFDLNMLDSFDAANSRTAINKKEGVISVIARNWHDAALFYQNVHHRIYERLMHIVNIKDAENVYLQVTQESNQMSGREKIDNVSDLIQNSPMPFFINTHFLGTHGPRFHPYKRKFSHNKIQDSDWDIDFYDDAILSFDGYVKEVINLLKVEGRYDNTIIIITSDHGQRWGIDEPIPLLIIFPKSEHQGIITTPTQRVDIAPTLLDYMGVTPPVWMEGNSLLQPMPSRYIITTRRTASSGKSGARHIKSPTPPYYTLGEVAISSCNTQYIFNLRANTILKSPLLNFIGNCNSLDLNKTSAKNQLILHLNQRDWDTSLLNK